VHIDGKFPASEPLHGVANAFDDIGVGRLQRDAFEARDEHATACVSFERDRVMRAGELNAALGDCYRGIVARLAEIEAKVKTRSNFNHGRGSSSSGLKASSIASGAK